MKILELLAPARNADIGIAAIDCGADAVYMAGEEFGARKDAGNPLSEVARVCEHAHKFGARVFLTVNTIIYDGELERAHRMMLEAQDAGVDGFIVQDLAVTGWDDITVPIHASTQCAIRTAEQARFYKSLGFGRLVVERETSLKDIQAIHDAVSVAEEKEPLSLPESGKGLSDGPFSSVEGTQALPESASSCELEYFVHGALCVCYSGQCYMSEHIAGRSANRGACIQACRSLYDLVDDRGNVLIRNKALLSLKDYRLINRVKELADAGVCSFKIEGRLKNASYVKNVVREYSLAMDEIIAQHPGEYMRASFGRVSGGFSPAADKTFNRGYTELWLDGKRGKWSSMDAPKSMGEFIGNIRSVKKLDRFTMELKVTPVDQKLELHNGDGFAFAGKKGIIGFRGDVCEGSTIRCKAIDGIASGTKLFRNINASFERELERNMPKREIRIDLTINISGSFNIDIVARSEDGREVLSPFKCDADVAENRERQEALMREQLSKRAEHYLLSVKEINANTAGGKLPLLSASILNSMRRLVASDIDAQPCKALPLEHGVKDESVKLCDNVLSYKYNVANEEARRLYESRGAQKVDDAYEISHVEGAELMRTRYCIRHELGLCPAHQGAKDVRPLFLINNGRRFALRFDCARCEMVVLSD